MSTARNSTRAAKSSAGHKPSRLRSARRAACCPVSFHGDGGVGTRGQVGREDRATLGREVRGDGFDADAEAETPPAGLDHARDLQRLHDVAPLPHLAMGVRRHAEATAPRLVSGRPGPVRRCRPARSGDRTWVGAGTRSLAARRRLHAGDAACEVGQWHPPNLAAWCRPPGAVTRQRRAGISSPSRACARNPSRRNRRCAMRSAMTICCVLRRPLRSGRELSPAVHAPRADVDAEAAAEVTTVVPVATGFAFGERVPHRDTFRMSRGCGCGLLGRVLRAAAAFVGCTLFGVLARPTSFASSMSSSAMAVLTHRDASRSVADDDDAGRKRCRAGRAGHGREQRRAPGRPRERARGKKAGQGSAWRAKVPGARRAEKPDTSVILALVAL